MKSLELFKHRESILTMSDLKYLDQLHDQSNSQPNQLPKD